MFDFIKKLVQPQKCAICHNKLERPTTYYNDRNEQVKVCYKCVPYAERRAYRKKR